MDWKRFLGPQLSKVMIFIILLLLFGVPVVITSCAGLVPLDAPPGTSLCTEPTLTMYNYLTYLFTTNVMDAVYGIEFSPFIIAAYLVVLYLNLSLLFHILGHDWKKVSMILLIIIALLVISVIFFSLMASRTFTA